MGRQLALLGPHRVRMTPEAGIVDGLSAREESHFARTVPHLGRRRRCRRCRCCRRRPGEPNADRSVAPRNFLLGSKNKKVPIDPGTRTRCCRSSVRPPVRRSVGDLPDADGSSFSGCSSFIGPRRWQRRTGPDRGKPSVRPEMGARFFLSGSTLRAFFLAGERRRRLSSFRRRLGPTGDDVAAKTMRPRLTGTAGSVARRAVNNDEYDGRRRSGFRPRCSRRRRRKKTHEVLEAAERDGGRKAPRNSATTTKDR